MKSALPIALATVAIGDRVGVPWVGRTCGQCRYCLALRENLCGDPGFTGYTIDGGYAERTVTDSRYCFHLSPRYSDVQAAPLPCAGLVGYRTLSMAGDAKRVGIYGFGAAAHIVAQVALLFYEGVVGREPVKRSRPLRQFCRSVELQHDAAIDLAALQFGENMIDIVQPIEMNPCADAAFRGEFE
jgi:D-arabinose 1-dehydrogenase-like Zn-dependent alcohol dehydrogenase